MSDDLDKLTDAELTELVAVEVAKVCTHRAVEHVRDGFGDWSCRACGKDPIYVQVPRYATSTDATMKLLESMGEDISIYRRFERDAPWEVCVVLFTEDCKRYMGRSKTLARAVCIVLILVARALKS